MSWDQEVREIERRRHLAKQQGGPEGIAKQHAAGRLTIRERVDALLDSGSFVEQGQATAIPDYDDDDELIGFVPANYVMGFGTIDDRRVVRHSCSAFAIVGPKDSLLQLQDVARNQCFVVWQLAS